MTSESIEADVPSLVRAAKLILGPVYLWDYTPDLLGMIAQIELWHQTIISRAEIALAANNNLIQYPYHDDGSPRGRCFLDSDRKALEDISDPNSVAARRKKYFMCTTALRREHIHQLVLEQEYDRVADQIQYYFPSPKVMQASAEPFILDVLPGEMIGYEALRAECHEFLRRAYAWDAEHMETLLQSVDAVRSSSQNEATVDSKAYQEAFNREFKREYDWPRVERVLIKWMDQIIEVTQIVEAAISRHQAALLSGTWSKDPQSA